MLGSALSGKLNWIVSGSVATWGLSSFRPTHGVLLNVPKMVRLQRLVKRQRNQFGARIDIGGDMHGEHEAFMEWAAAYEERVGTGRNLASDSEFLLSQCDAFMSIDEIADMDVIAGKIMHFLSSKTEPNEALEARRGLVTNRAFSSLREGTSRPNPPPGSA
jgi:hypothetical protein